MLGYQVVEENGDHYIEHVPIRQINNAIHIIYYVHTYYTPSIGSSLELMFLLKKNHYCH